MIIGAEKQRLTNCGERFYDIQPEYCRENETYMLKTSEL
jgi:hypothetical protein